MPARHLMMRLPRGITVEVTKSWSEGLIFTAGDVHCGPLGEVVGDLADKLVSTMSRWF